MWLSAGCASAPRAGWEPALRTLEDDRRRSAENPSDYELRIKVQREEQDAARSCYESGRRLEEAGRWDDAMGRFREGLAVLPGDEVLSRALQEASDKREAAVFARRALEADQAGREDEARSLLEEALDLDPGQKEAEGLRKAMEERDRSGTPQVPSRTVSLHFDQTDLRAAFDFLGKSFGLSVIFDRKLKDQKVDFSVENVTLDRALELLRVTTRTIVKRIDERTILVADDTQENREAYDDLVTATLPLNSAKAEDMAALLKTVLEFKHIGFDKDTNALLIRAPERVLELVRKIVAANDRPRAEVLLDVEILEVDRTKEEQVGLDYGSQVTYSAPDPPSTIHAYRGMSLADILSQGTLTLPSGTFNYLKKDVKARTLAHPQVRVLTNEEAKIHIGDKVPVPSAVVQQTSGAVQTSYNYTDVGVMLDVVPVVNPDGTIRVKLNLEVSSLGANLGTSANPAYDIGTRDAQTSMLLRDGETAVMGGLIQDRDSKTRLQPPILGDLPLLGGLFTNYFANSQSRTDLLLTITPRILRGWSLPRGIREIDSGTEANPTGGSVQGRTSERGRVVSEPNQGGSTSGGPARLGVATVPMPTPAGK